MEKMAKFRNIVVHHYDHVDAEIIVGILKKDLDDFPGYRTAILSYLEPEPVDSTDSSALADDADSRKEK
jgi:uncharacterized protein YutE (UPF0331/DUF86 family)